MIYDLSSVTQAPISYPNPEKPNTFSFTSPKGCVQIRASVGPPHIYEVMKARFFLIGRTMNQAGTPNGV